MIVVPVVPVVACILLAAAAVAIAPTPDRRHILLVVLLALVVGWLVYFAEDADPTSSSGYRVTGAAAVAFEESMVPTSTSSPAERIAPTPPASVSPRRGKTTSPAPAGDVADLGVFKMTCYGPPLFPAGQTTASGDPVGPGSIAVDPAVIPLGTVLEVEGYGRGVANDRGSKVRGRHVDVWVSDPSPCPWSSARVRVVSGR